MIDPRALVAMAPGTTDTTDTTDATDATDAADAADRADTTADAASQRIRALLQGTRRATPALPSSESFRVAGVPLVLAVVAASGPGWTADGHRAAAHSPSTDGSQARQRAAAAGLHPVEPSGVPVLTYRVRPGDTVSAIARRTGTSVRAVLSANGLRPTSVIRPGQVLTLPGLPRLRAHGSARRPATRPVVHVVRPGDTLWDLARRFGISVDAVSAANRLDGDAVIRPGQKLRMPGAPSRPPARMANPPTVAHVVRRGETVTAIARRHGVGVRSMLMLNGLGGRTPIHPGRRLLVPSTHGEVATAGVHPAPQARNHPARPPAGVPFRRYPAAVTRAAAANRAALGRRDVPTRAATRELVAGAARRHGVDPALALAVADMESGFDQRQVSTANAVGVMQVIPSSGVWASQLVGRPLDLMDAEDNVEAGVALLAALRERADEPTAIAGYYQGLAGVRRHGMYADTRRYVATVRALMTRYR